MSSKVTERRLSIVKFITLLVSMSLSTATTVMRKSPTSLFSAMSTSSGDTIKGFSSLMSITVILI